MLSPDTPLVPLLNAAPLLALGLCLLTIFRSLKLSLPMKIAITIVIVVMVYLAGSFVEFRFVRPYRIR